MAAKKSAKPKAATRPSPRRKVDVKKRKRVYDGFFKIDRAVVTYTDPFGDTVKDATIEVFERGDSAAALLHDVANKQVILTEQFRFPTYAKGPGWIIEAAAGSVEEGEAPEACVKREMMEELGYKLGKLTPIATYYVSPGGTSERVFLYYAPVKSADLKNPNARGIAGAHESVKRVIWSEAELFAALDAGTLLDAKALIAAMWLRRRIERS